MAGLVVILVMAVTGWSLDYRHLQLVAQAVVVLVLNTAVAASEFGEKGLLVVVFLVRLEKGVRMDRMDMVQEVESHGEPPCLEPEGQEVAAALVEVAVVFAGLMMLMSRLESEYQ